MNNDHCISLGGKILKETEVKPLFSVALVTFEQRRFLNDCLDSVFMQDYSRIELIVCDDFSADFDTDEVRRYIDAHKGNNIVNVVVYQQPGNVGTCANCQKAFELSSGEYLKFFAGDDLLSDSDVLSSMAAYLKYPSNGLVFSRARGMKQNGEKTNNLYPDDYSFNLAKSCGAHRLFELYATHCWGKFFFAPSSFWRRDLLTEIGGFNLKYKYTEDWPAFLSVCERGITPLYTDEVTLFYRYGGISNNQDEQHFEQARVHYMESSAILLECALPVLREKYSWFSRLCCWYAAVSLEARCVYEIDWFRTWNFTQKLGWLLHHIPYFIVGTFLMMCDGRMYPSLKKPAVVCIITWFILYFDIIVCPFWNNELAASLILCFATLWAIAVFGIRLFVRICVTVSRSLSIR